MSYFGVWPLSVPTPRLSALDALVFYVECIFRNNTSYYDDLSSNRQRHNVGTLTGTANVRGATGDGASGYGTRYSTTAVGATFSAITLEACMSSSTSSTTRAAASIGYTASNAQCGYLGVGSTAKRPVAFLRNDASTAVTLLSGTAWTDGVPFYNSVTWDGTTASQQSHSSTAVTAAFSGTMSSLNTSAIGALFRLAGASLFFPGTIYAFGVWNRKLTDAERTYNKEYYTQIGAM